MQPHIDGEAEDKEMRWAPFWLRLDTLERIGAIEWVPHLLEGADPDAEIIHPLGLGGSGSVEDQIGLAAHNAGLALLPEDKHRLVRDEGLQLVPVPRHIGDVQLFGLARLRYRSHTRHTAAWFQDYMTKCDYHLDHYAQLGAGEDSMRKRRRDGPAKRSRNS